MRLVPVLTALALGFTLTAAADKKTDDAVARAEAQLAKGKEEEAVKLLQKNAARASRDPLAQLALAQLLVRLGRLDAAGEALAKAGELASGAPPAARARVFAARSAFALHAGTVEEATELARQAVAAERGADSLAALARAEARSGDPAARATAEEAVRAAPGSVAAELASGRALLAAGLAREAEAAYRRAATLAPRSGEALAGLAMALAAQRKPGPALEAAHAATQADPRSAEALVALSLAGLAQDPHDKSGDAVAAVQQAAFLEPKNAAVRLAVGRVFESRDQLDQAGAAYEQAASLDPTWAAPRIAALALQLRRGDAQGPLAGLRALPDAMKATGEAQLLLARLLLRSADAAGAKQAAAAAVAALPGVAEAHAAQGDAAHETGDRTLAADAYGKAVELDPDDLSYRSRYGLYLARDGRLEQGLAVMLEVTSQPQGRDASSLVDLGWVYRSFKPPRVKDAVAAYEQALKLDPGNGDAALGVAESYRAGGQWARAISAYEHVPDVDRRREKDALVGIAWCYCYSHDLARARFYASLAARAGAKMHDLRAALSQSCSAAPDERR
jgi:tetratricopeptide (TPR) repeat protein